jgi:hypothetical protein
LIDIGYTTTSGADTITESCNSIVDANDIIFALKETLSTRDDIATLFMQQLMPNEDDELVMEKFAWLDSVS